MNDKTERERILDKIKKCLRLSKSSEPHEAAAAMRQAQKLMEAYNVTGDEISDITATDALVWTNEIPRKKTPLYLNALISLIHRAFAVSPVLEDIVHTSRNGTASVKLGVRYWGANGRAELAKYTHEVIWRQLWNGWKTFAKQNPHIASRKNARTGWWLGYMNAIERKVMEFANTDAEKAAIERKMLSHYGKSLEKTAKANEISVDAAAAGHGVMAGSDFELNRPMSGETVRQIGHMD